MGNFTTDNYKLLMKDWELDSMKSDCQKINHLFRTSVCVHLI